jgi:hypothetical protein
MATKDELVEAMRQARKEERREQTGRTMKILGFCVVAAFVAIIAVGMIAIAMQ